MKNKIVGSLIVVTGVLFAAAVFTPDRHDHETFVTASKLIGLGIITGFSAVATRFLIKENN
jgi:uncharacterized membrane protein